MVRSRGPIDHPGRTTVAIAAGPTGRGRPRHLEPIRGLRDRPTILDDATGQAQPAKFRQRGITVRHEDLRVMVRMPIQLHTSPGGPPSIKHRYTRVASHQPVRAVQLARPDPLTPPGLTPWVFGARVHASSIP